MQPTEDFHTHGQHEIPEPLPPPRNEIYTRRISKDDDPANIPSAGVNTEGLETAIRHQSLGVLPGPAGDYYKSHSFKKTRSEDAKFNEEI